MESDSEGDHCCRQYLIRCQIQKPQDQGNDDDVPLAQSKRMYQQEEYTEDPESSDEDVIPRMPTRRRRNILVETSEEDERVAPSVENGKEREKPKLIRKRQRREEEWPRNKRKKLRQSGQAYISSSGKEIKARQMGPGCGTKCRYRCKEKLDVEERGETVLETGEY